MSKIQPNQKMGKRSKEIFLPRYTDGLKTHKEMLNITNFREILTKTAMT